MDIGESSSYVNVDSVAGGIVGKNYIDTYNAPEIIKEQNIIKITNSQNYGSIIAENHLGGIIGISTAATVEVDNCEVSGVDSENRISIIDTKAGSKGGIIGFSENYLLSIKNCNVN